MKIVRGMKGLAIPGSPPRHRHPSKGRGVEHGCVRKSTLHKKRLRFHSKVLAPTPVALYPLPPTRDSRATSLSQRPVEKMGIREGAGQAIRSVSPMFPVIGGTVAFIVAAYTFLTQGAPGTLFIAITTIIIFGVVFAIAAAVFAWLYAKDRSAVENAKASRDDALRKFKISTTRINEMLALDYEHCINLRNPVTDRDSDEIRNKLKEYLTELLGNVATLFSEYTGQECAACIKVLSKHHDHKEQLDYENSPSDSEASFVYTYSRDPKSRLRRSQADNATGLDLYRFEQNAAFAKIMHSEILKGYYFKNDLASLGDEYWNINKKWPDLYNAVAVAALKTPHKDEVVEALGFICVDNKGGGFDNETCRQLLESVASIVYYTLRVTVAAINEEVRRPDGI